MSHHPDEDISCKEVVELVTDYLDDALDDDLRTRVEMHLVMCGGCDAYLGQTNRTIEVVAALDDNRAEPEGLARLLETFAGWRRRADEEA